MKGSTSQFYRGVPVAPQYLVDPLYSDGERCFTWNVYSGKRYLSNGEWEVRRLNDLYKFGCVRVRVRAKTERVYG